MATITTRSGKGSPLTNTEIDSNFTNLNTDKVETSSISTFGATLIDDADASTARSTLGLGSAATTASSDYATAAQGALANSAVQPSDNVSDLTNDAGYLTANQTITLSGDASGSGTTSISVTVSDDSHNHSSSSGDFSVGGDLSVAGITKSTANSVSATGASTTIDMTASNFHVITMSSSTTFTFSNLSSAVTASGTFVIKQDATGGREFTLPSSCKTPIGGASIVQSTGANTTSILSYIVVSSTEVLVNYVGNFA